MFSRSNDISDLYVHALLMILRWIRPSGPGVDFRRERSVRLETSLQEAHCPAQATSTCVCREGHSQNHPAPVHHTAVCHFPGPMVRITHLLTLCIIIFRHTTVVTNSHGLSKLRAPLVLSNLRHFPACPSA